MRLTQRNLYPIHSKKKFLILIQKKNFFLNEKTDFGPKEKISYAYPKINFFSTQRKSLLYLPQKTIF